MSRFRPRGAALLAVLAAVPFLTACTATSTAGSAPRSGEGQTITVFAAASLRGVFTDIGSRFEAEHPGSRVQFTFAGSADLVTQLLEGAPADVLASADSTTMQRVVDAGAVEGDPQAFASNTLIIVTPPKNPAEVNSFADLASPGLRLVVCASQVPCGAATASLAADLRIDLHPVSEEHSVADVLGKVTSGQADAGVVYRTDARLAGSAVASIPFPQSARAVNRYPIAVLRESKNPALAGEFAAFIRSETGLDALTLAGFGAP